MFVITGFVSMDINYLMLKVRVLSKQLIVYLILLLIHKYT